MTKTFFEIIISTQLNESVLTKHFEVQATATQSQGMSSQLLFITFYHEHLENYSLSINNQSFYSKKYVKLVD